MAVIRDVMPAFELFQPNSVADAQKLLTQYGADAWVMAGGMDSFDWLKDRIKRPKAVVDLSCIEELKGVRDTGDGIEIGALTTLTEVVNHPLIKQQYDLLRQAAELVASPQIRNQGTLGGNVSQDTRCWYYRAGWPCYRAGGNSVAGQRSNLVNVQFVHQRLPVFLGRLPADAQRAGYFPGQKSIRDHLEYLRLTSA